MYATNGPCSSKMAKPPTPAPPFSFAHTSQFIHITDMIGLSPQRWVKIDKSFHSNVGLYGLYTYCCFDWEIFKDDILWVSRCLILHFTPVICDGNESFRCVWLMRTIVLLYCIVLYCFAYVLPTCRGWGGGGCSPPKKYVTLHADATVQDQRSKDSFPPHRG